MVVIRREKSERGVFRWLERAVLIGIILFLLFQNQSGDIATENLQEFLSSTEPIHKTSTETASLIKDDFALAYRESLEFFDDITRKDWLLRKHLTKSRKHNAEKADPYQPRRTPAAWYQTNWDPDFACFHEHSIGELRDGHKWLCDPHRLRKKPDCLVYSFGSNQEFSFEKHLKEVVPNCEVHIFDPDDYSKAMSQSGVNATYHAWGMKPSYKSDKDKTRTKFSDRFERKLEGLTFKTIQETMDTLGHMGRRIDVFKIDCEGCEWKTYKDFLSVDIRQFLVETHDWCYASNDFMKDFHEAGYAMFHKEPNIQWSNGNCIEFSFIKLSKEFFQV